MRLHGSFGVFACAATLLAPGCALRPPADAFPVELPTSLDASRPLAVVGDLQQTRGFVRWFMKTESTAEEQPVLIADLHERMDEIAGLVIVGDLVYTGGSRSDWKHFDALVAPVSRAVPVLPAIGNHDYYCVFIQKCMHHVVPKEFRLRFPWFAPGQPYAVAYGDVMLAFLDSETELEAQGVWLAEKMREWAPTYRAVLIVFHRPPFTNVATGRAGPDLEVREQVVPRLEGASPVPVVINGHIHGYEHLVIDGIHYVTTAGGGGPRGWLAPERPNDVYPGPDCGRNELGQIQRPFNYLLIERRSASLAVTVRGFCNAADTPTVLESFEIPLP
jgi:UDP-2,3-diacylglucosamine pyrophosphatase LpxH